MNESEYAFEIVGRRPSPPPLVELELLVNTLDFCRHSVEQWSEQERCLSDQKIYVKTGDSWEEVKLVRATSKCLFVRLACGSSRCLSAGYFSQSGTSTRRSGSTVQCFAKGWKIRQDLLYRIETTRGQYAKIKRYDIPDLVRSIRHTGDSVPHDLVQRLKSHYGR